MKQRKEDDDYFKELFEQSFMRILDIGIAMLVGIAICALLSACRTQYVPIETVRTDTVHSTEIVLSTDTVTNTKETIIREVSASDSALLAAYGIRLNENERLLLFLQKELAREKSRDVEHSTDTIIKTDTVQVPYPVEGKVPKWEKVKLACTGAVTMAAVIAVMGTVLWLRRRCIRK